MVLKVIAGMLSVVLLGAFVAPVVVKLQDIALSSVIVIGFAMMLIDLWQSFKSKDD